MHAVAGKIGKIAASPPLETIKKTIFVAWGKHPLVQLQQPEWPVAREIAAAMAKDAASHNNSNGCFFILLTRL